MSSSFARVALVAIVLILLACLGVWQFLSRPNLIPMDDYVEYWAAGRLNADGQNPYDRQLMLEKEISIGRKDIDQAVMMWNPPWTLTAAMPIGLLPPRVGQLIWLVLGFILILLSCDYLWRFYNGPAESRAISWMLAVLFLPTSFVLHAGQVGPLVLAGAVGFLYFLRTGRPALAGASCVLLAIKPHLAYLFWPVLAGWVILRMLKSPAKTEYRILAGGIIAAVIATLIPLCANPSVISQYLYEITHNPPAQWQSPTLGTVLRYIGDEGDFTLQFLPQLLGFTWLIWDLWTKRRRLWDWGERMPMLLLVSFVTTPYGAWPFDLVLLLPAVMQAGAVILRHGERDLIALGCIAFAAIDLGALALNVARAGSFWFIWMAPCLLLAYILLMRNYQSPVSHSQHARPVPIAL